MIIWILPLVVAPLLGLYLAFRFRRETPGDPKINELIEKNRFRFREGMNTPDWSRVTAIGAERWDETVRAQERLRR